jgi:hypothetical protein
MIAKSTSKWQVVATRISNFNLFCVDVFFSIFLYLWVVDVLCFFHIEGLMYYKGSHKIIILDNK